MPAASRYEFAHTLSAVLANHPDVTDTELGRRVGVHRNTVRKWLGKSDSGKPSPPNTENFEKIIKELPCSPKEERRLREAYPGTPPRELTLHHLPLRRAPLFTGREDVLKQLHQRLKPGSRIAITQAVTGLGGVGKTYLALEYAYRYQSEYLHILWAAADSERTLTSEFSKLAYDLHLVPEHDRTPTLSVLQDWLYTHDDWLLILDNVEDLSLVDGPKAIVPKAQSGAVLFTTRIQATVDAVTLPCMSSELGALFLLRRSGRLALEAPVEEAHPEDYRLALQLSRTLGGLPLALDQAGAYIEDSCTFADYLALYQQRRQELLATRGYLANEISDHKASVETTFSLIFEKQVEKSPIASDALRLCALLAPEPIPDALFFQWEALSGTALADMKGDPKKFHDAIEVLRRASLIQRNPDKKTISVHPLVQAVLRDRMNESFRKHWQERAVRAIAALSEDGTIVSPHLQLHAWELLSGVKIHACELLSGGEIAEVASDITWDDCLDRLDRLLADRTIPEGWNSSESDDPTAVDMLNTLGIVSFLHGRHDEAEALYQRSLAIQAQQPESDPESDPTKSTFTPDPLDDLSDMEVEEIAKALVERHTDVDGQIDLEELLNELDRLFPDRG